MARKRIITPKKKELISRLIEEYNIKTAKDLQEALKDLLGDTLKNMLEAELDDQFDMKSTNLPKKQNRIIVMDTHPRL